MEQSVSRILHEARSRTLRSFSLAERGQIDEERRSVDLSISSEQVVERWFGREVLDHSEAAVDLSRLNDGAPVLVNHDTDDQVGVVERAYLDPATRKLRAVVRFGRSARAQEIFQDVVDGIRRNVSIAYRIGEMALDGDDSEAETYRATRWMPYEVSTASVPADNTVGVGRNLSESRPEVPPSALTHDSAEKERIQILTGEEKSMSAMNEGIASERTRVNEILGLGRSYDSVELAEQYVRDGKSIEDFRGTLLEKLRSKPVAPPQDDKRDVFGIPQSELRSFSFSRAISALMAGDVRMASYESEVSQQLARSIGRSTRGFLIPIGHTEKRADNPTLTANVGSLIQKELMVSSFVEILRNRMITAKLGVQSIGGCSGNLFFPVETTNDGKGIKPAFVQENAQYPITQITTDEKQASPNIIAAGVKFSRKTDIQSSIGFEMFVRNRIAQGLASAIDEAILIGSGKNSPKGILTILQESGNSNRIVAMEEGTPFGWKQIVALETRVATQNADFGKLAYATNSLVRGYLKTTVKAPNTGTFIWQEGGEPGWGELNGFRAGVTNTIPSNLGAAANGSGGKSAMIFGNWDDIIVPEWGVMELIVDPYTGSTQGITTVTANHMIDSLLLRSDSFSACTAIDV